VNADGRVSGIDRGHAFELRVDGERVSAYPGETIAAALVAAGQRALRHTALRGEPAASTAPWECAANASWW
jgi:2Fe-2S iron-sulfur cluster binding domain